MESELDLACCRCQRSNAPVVLEAAERPPLQTDAKPFGTPLGIARREAKADAAIVDPDLGSNDRVVTRKNGRAGAPREERGIVLRDLDQIEHGRRSEADER
jgi:hypothetical protein